MTDAELAALWDDLCARLTWRYPIAEAKRRYEALADDEEPDLIAWHQIGRKVTNK